MNAVRHYIVRRLLSAVPVLLGISLLAFVLAQLSPGDPAEIMLEAAGTGMPSAEEVAALHSYLGLDQPAYVQYGLWLWRILHGDGGISYHLGMPVFTVLLARLPVTVMLGNFAAAVLGGAIIVETVFALPGIGSLALDAIHYRDYPLLQGYVLFLGGIYVLVTLAVDLVLARMDPRIVLGGGD